MKRVGGARVRVRGMGEMLVIDVGQRAPAVGKQYSYIGSSKKKCFGN